ncbi:hypothetical protein EOM09_08250 [bacterium]|nr:hypothetical protein [bacterium]
MSKNNHEVDYKLYFTIVNKEMYEDLTSRLHKYTDIVWSITNDLIKTPFHTMFNKNRELLFLDITDGTLSYGELKDFELYYENPKYELLTNEKFFILSKELFPNSKSNSNRIIVEEY